MSSARTDLCRGCRVTGIPTATNWKAELDEDNRGEFSFLVWSQKQLRMDILNEIALQEWLWRKIMYGVRGIPFQICTSTTA